MFHSRNVVELVERCLQPTFIIENSSRLHQNLAKILGAVDSFFCFPVGSFALGQLRKDNPTLDFAFVFTMTQPEDLPPIKELQHIILRSLKFALELDSAKTGIRVDVKPLEKRYDNKTHYLEIVGLASGVTMRLFAHESGSSSFKGNTSTSLFLKYDPSIVHTTVVDTLLKQHEDRRLYFNSLCATLKWWRY